MSNNSNDLWPVTPERSNWRDERISKWHRNILGHNCPCVDLDFVVAEYNYGNPKAIIEYKHSHAPEPNFGHNSYNALTLLGKGCNIPVSG